MFDLTTAPPGRRHAVVIGGSIAGLLAARVLAPHFERVSILERDRLADQPEFRKGVPQARHFHLLLARGLMILEQLLPGIEADLQAGGAVPLEWGAEALWFLPAGWAPRYYSGLRTYSLSRDLLEWCVRRRVRSIKNIAFRTTAEVIELLSDPGRSRISGVRVRCSQRAESAPGAVESLSADLVVDASGRNTRMPQWLEALGYGSLEQTKINAFMGYATRYYARPENFHGQWKSLNVFRKPPAMLRGGALFPLEGDRWIVTLGGGARDYPPTDEAGYLEFARSLRSPLLYETIQGARPVSPIYGFQNAENCLRHYERLPRWPERLVVLGDATCAFNPLYGQGITMAGRGALLLERCLQEQPGAELTGLGQRFQKNLAELNTYPWLMATGEDFRYPVTEGGQRSMRTRFMHWYMDRVQMLATEKASMFTTYIEVVNMLKPPGVFFQPEIAAGVLAKAFRRQPADSPSPPGGFSTPMRTGDPSALAGPASPDGRY
ncbi:FAD-dependent oxidoreductase [Gloeobacter violaceus]|uniref:Gll1952 protein n=1 Tax=Gloeobacter violaceus (strain ATCC 29082 / PCC 7421) TaxID=251221 RepID=Q7NJ80_GLOVI|nr:hypothetical protein [Gloeobacter violaceus]BAC89893.1 gll1952 [Gloeobacter violaceus PCC 7421]